MIYFLADTHFNHRLVKSYRINNFEFILLNNIFKKLSDKDILYHLGDFAFNFENRNVLEIWKSIPAYKILIYGNHDLMLRDRTVLEEFFDEIKEFYDSLEYEGYRFLLTHYPAKDKRRKRHRDKEERVRKLFYEGNYHILVHGHIHGAHIGNKCACYEEYRILCMNVNIEYINYEPISIVEVLSKLRGKLPPI